MIKGYLFSQGAFALSFEKCAHIRIWFDVMWGLSTKKKNSNLILTKTYKEATVHQRLLGMEVRYCYLLVRRPVQDSEWNEIAMLIQVQFREDRFGQAEPQM